MPRQYRSLRKKLLLQGKSKCHYCQIEVSTVQRRSKTPVHDTCATIEHLYPKGDIRRYLSGSKDNVVLACYKCNQERNEHFHAQVNAEHPLCKVNIKSILATGLVIACLTSKH
jgi:hypothetical protein